MKIAYVVVDHAYNRVFESFKERTDCEQYVICKRPVVTTNLVPEDYSAFGLKNRVYFSNATDLQKVINNLAPDVYCQAELDDIHTLIKLPKKCKRVFVAHGIIARKMLDVAKEMGLIDKYKASWSVFDLCCGATQDFIEFLTYLGVSSDKVMLDALPQIDLVYNSAAANRYRDRVLGGLKRKDVERSVLFFGNRCGSRNDYLPFNRDFFDVLFELDTLAKNNPNMLVMVKQKNSPEKTLKFLKIGLLPKDYLDRYTSLLRNTRLHFISTNTHPYGYFFADLIISSGGGSTIEVDAAAPKKPLLVYRSDNHKFDPDPIRSIEHGAVIVCKSIADINKHVTGHENYSQLHTNQDHYLKSIGITADGGMGKRIVDRIVSL